MENPQILPVLDVQELQNKANEFAMKGAIEAFKEFYTGYNSPYKKALEDTLKKTEIGSALELPDIIALMNSSLSKEIDAIANEAVAKTFVPMVQRFLTRVEKEITMSEVLKTFVEETESELIDDVSFEIVKDPKYSWYNVTITSEKEQYEFTLHEEYSSKRNPEPGAKKRLQLLSLPHAVEKHRTDSFIRSSYTKQQMMKVSIGDATLEMPFVKDVLHDGFVTFCARMILCKTVITLDTEEFSEEMFPERNNY